ncbi:hypothetical protein ACJMK2_037242 [Sinanodonta woodiana]|uniref:Uncharacterized protein n=1 Tax=Sinanodonta woodiana TaxID=1069815 RepID=A0ABD3WLI3_SINWO
MIEDIGKHCYNANVEGVRNGQPLRIIVDNINVFVEALYDFIGLMTLTDIQTIIPPVEACMVEMESWFNDTMDKFIDEYVLGRITHATNRIQIDTEEIIVTQLRLLLLNGSISTVSSQNKKKICVVRGSL